MIIVYLFVGTLSGIAAGLLVGSATGSVLLGLLCLPLVSSVAIMATAAAMYLRSERDETSAPGPMIPAE